MPKRLIFILILAITALLLPLTYRIIASPTPGGEGNRSIQSMWVELGPGGTAIARLITTQPTCPRIQAGEQSLPMQVHAKPSQAFPVQVCEQTIPANVTATINGQSWPKLVTNPKRIVVIGDTGCRLSQGQAQACKDPQAWAFQRVAQSAAAWKPDLVIHVGDYLYREAACPKGNMGCAGSPWGDNWDAWNADLFIPATKLLQVAPWVVVRGNHELCDRGGNGWFHFLDPRPLSGSCQDYTEPYAIPLGNPQLLVMDSAKAEDGQVKADQVKTYIPQFKTLANLATKNSWLMIHRPMWAFAEALPLGKSALVFPLNLTLQSASANALPLAVQLVLSGHVHLFERVSFTSRRPSQFVVGNSGTRLDSDFTTSLSGLVIGGEPVASDTVLGEFGYTTIEASSQGWIVTPRTVNGLPQTTCKVRDWQVICAT